MPTPIPGYTQLTVYEASPRPRRWFLVVGPDRENDYTHTYVAYPTLEEAVRNKRSGVIVEVVEVEK